MAKNLFSNPLIIAIRGISTWPAYRGNRRGIAVLLAGLLSFGLVTAVQARPGDLDPSFDADGKVLTHFNGFEEASALVAQPNGKLVAAGTLHRRRTGQGMFALARYRPDGQLDRGFGRKGRVVTVFGARSAAAAALVIQSDRKLVAAGSSSADGGSFDFALARYNPDGSLDPSFGSGGQVLTDLGGSDRANAVALQPDGKIVAAGVSGTAFALVRYNPDGTLDTGFGSGGRVLTRIGALAAASSLELQADGKLVAAGASQGTFADFAVARYNPDGSLDPSFGSGGQVLTDLSGSDQATALALQPDGKIVAAGASGAGFALVRYNPDGTLDTGFGSGGRVLTDIGGSDAATSLVLQANGKLVAAGISADGPDSAFALLRYNVDGSLDATFGNAGVVFSFLGGDTEFVKALVLQDGKLVAVGTSDGGSVFATLPNISVVDCHPLSKLLPLPPSPSSVIRICISLRPGQQVHDTDFALARYLVRNARPQLPPKCGGRPATILGTAKSDTIRGTAAEDVILGLGANDTIRGLEGNDIICGGPGNDRLLGNEGDDSLLGESGNDRLFGDTGGNSLDGGSGTDSCKPNRGSKDCETQGATRPRDPPKPTVPTCSPVTNVPCVQR
ncbi:MAG: hypothetical protein ACT4QB_22015 [Gammaproteobacteria bacterium]